MLIETAVTPEQMEGLSKFFGKLPAYAPSFKGAMPVEEAIPIIRATWERASIDSGYGGAFVSHFGNKQWL